MHLRLILMFLTISFCGQASLKSDIYGLIQRVDPNHDMGVYVVDAKTGEPIYTHNAERFYTPASVLKIFTDAMALDVLGPDFTFKTQLWGQGKDNTIILRFGGDPTLLFEDLVTLFQNVKHPVSKIIIDISDPFPLRSPPDNWMIDDQDFCHGIAATPMIVNRNSVRFSLTSKQSNKAPDITVTPNHFLTIEGTPQVRKKCGVAESFRRKHMLLMYPILQIQPSCVEPSETPMKLCLPILPNQLQAYIQQMVSQAWQQVHGKKVSIVLKPVASYKSCALLTEHVSQDLMTILKKAMADSDNLIMDSLLLQILKRIAPEIQEWRDVGGIVQCWAQKRLKADLSHSVVTEGAGLSHANMMTPTQIGSFLSHIYRDTKFYGLFDQTLPVQEQEGTLQECLGGVKMQVKAKTGTLRRRILGLAGYLTTKSGKVLAFSFMANSNFYVDEKADKRNIHWTLEKSILERLTRL